MQPSGLRKRSSLRLVLFILAIIAMLVSLSLQNASAHSAVSTAVTEIVTSTSGYWKFINATTFDNFTALCPRSTWFPSYGDYSNGGTIVEA
jgi:hypothetical protein